MPMYLPLLFLPFILFFSYVEMYIVAIFFGWLVFIRILALIASRLPFSQAIYWIHAMTFEFLTLLSVVFLRFLPSIKNGKGSSRPILLVHGYLNQPNVWWLQKKWLQSLGLGPIYTIRLSHPFRSIRDYAEDVVKKCEKIVSETKREDILLVGHSMGGLVCLWSSLKIASQKKMQVITIASPLSGTPVAKIGFGPNAKQMQKNSPFLKELHKAVEQNRDIQLQHIATYTDQLVIPGSSAVFKENDHCIFNGIGHASLLYSKKVAKQIDFWVRSGNRGLIANDGDLNP